MKKFLLLSIFAPLTTFAAANDFGTLRDLLNNITKNVIATAATLFLALAVVAFFVGIVRFIIAKQQGVEKEVQKGEQFMLWGIIALFVMFSVYGIIRFAQNTLGPDFSNTTINIPKINVNGSSGGSSGDPLSGDKPTGAGCPNGSASDGNTCPLGDQIGICVSGACKPDDSYSKPGGDGPVCSIDGGFGHQNSNGDCIPD